MAQLNKQQSRASLADEGVSLVLAGAGTGKTKTLVEKVKNIIQYSACGPGNILILTFSRKAAEEIKKRIKSDIGDSADNIVSGTFHSFCLTFLRDNRGVFMASYGFSEFPAILDNKSKDRLIFDVLQDRVKRMMGIPPAVIYDIIRKMPNLNMETLKKLKQSGLYDEIYGIINLISEKKRELNLIDFDDMIGFATNLLQKNKDLQNAVTSRFKYIFVDEFQDTSDDNFKLLKLLLSPGKPNLFAVGDDWQSIYGFRNARVEYIIKMKNYFPNVNIHKLKINYRSRKEIVKLSNRFIRKNRKRTRKTLKSYQGKGGRVYYYNVNDFQSETGLINQVIKKEKKISKSIAVIYRNNRQGEFIKNHTGFSACEFGQLNFLTMHASKGLEFDVVLVVGVSDKIIPDRTTDIEEERRLFYVALTRARERLHVFSHLNENGEDSIFGRELGIKEKRMI